MKALLDQSENLFKQRSRELSIMRCFYFENHYMKADRVSCIKTMRQYKKQLMLERSFYENFHNNFIKEIDALCAGMEVNERSYFWEKAFPGLYKNQATRLAINSAKNEATTSMIALLLLINSNSKSMKIVDGQFTFSDDLVQQQYSDLLKVIDANLDAQYELAEEQKASSESNPASTAIDEIGARRNTSRFTRC